MHSQGALQTFEQPTIPSAVSALLTPRECQVMSLIAEGLSNKDIAVRLQLAVHTVKTHVHSVLTKMRLTTRLELAVRVHAGDRYPRIAANRLFA